MATFEFLRLSLSIPTLGKLALDEQRREPNTTRKDFLAEAFSSRRDFFYSGRLFTFMPGPPETQGPDYFTGYIGKPVEEMVNAGPEQMFALTASKHYRASFVAIDTRPDQQVVAFEKRADVGSAQRILEAMMEAFVRERQSLSWHTDAEFLSSAKDFWSAAREYEGRITEISFEFFPPNGLEGFEKFKKFDKLAKQQANGQSSEYSIKNPDGAIKPSGEFVEEAVEYASEGPGRVQMKEGRKVLFSSRQARKTKDAPEQLMPRQGEGSKILGMIGWLFGTKPHGG